LLTTMNDTKFHWLYIPFTIFVFSKCLKITTKLKYIVIFVDTLKLETNFYSRWYGGGFILTAGVIFDAFY
jgi:hypothetical protein